MEKISLMAVLSLIFMISVASMCSKDDPIPQSNPSVDPTPVINIVNNGTWRVTFYEDSGVNEISNYTGYNFTFGSSSTLTATNGTNTYTGSWSVTSDNSGDDSPSNDLDFNISFSAPVTFVDLTDDWNILEYTTTKVRLIHVSGGNGGTDYITFEKN
ncbi:hypothetical protein [Flavobacterium sp.]|uniref:hypothetical protein n=1 Tax=Flavobacterium sp. TaxID=239 RepID=UPI0037519724